MDLSKGVHIDRAAFEYLRQSILNAQQPNKAHVLTGRELNHQVDIALLPKVVSGGRTKHRQRVNAFLLTDPRNIRQMPLNHWSKHSPIPLSGLELL